MSKYWIKAISFLLTIILLGYLFYLLDTNQALKTLKNIKINFLLVASLFYFLTYIFRAIRFKILIGKRVNFKTLVFISWVHGFFNKVIPARIGEVSYITLIRKETNITLGEGAAHLLVVRIFDLIGLMSLFLLSLLFININIKINLLQILFLLAVLFIFLVFSPKVLGLISPTFDQSKNIILNRISIFICDFKEALKKFNCPSKIVYLFVNTLLVWLSMYISFYSVVKGFDMELGFIEVVFASVFPNLTSILPINGLGGFGTMEAGWTFGYMLVGIDKNLAITTGIVANLVAFVITVILGLLGYIMLNKSKFSPLNRRSEKN